MFSDGSFVRVSDPNFSMNEVSSPRGTRPGIVSPDLKRKKEKKTKEKTGQLTGNKTKNKTKKRENEEQKGRKKISKR